MKTVRCERQSLAVILSILVTGVLTSVLSSRAEAASQERLDRAAD